MGDRELVRAAGGLVTRPGAEGRPEILLVHRPRYDDWTFPKGKAEPGESDEECALREVEEEAALECDLGDEVATVEYEDARGRPKRVVYYAMTPRDGADAAPRNEVDAVRWMPFDEAGDVLTYERDRDIARRLAHRT
jgi:8-oxo-dGTP pyrophosphatase MutT (NUDIX family)